ncbi:MAG: apolipoprotein N-acyltransferase [Desulfatibacillum sp.]|nr:apolipoprotein N-acyltransferase [Desulfatibacillum sp.]
MVLGTAHWLFYALIHEYEKTWTTALFFVSAFAILPYGLLFSCFALAYGYLKRDSLFFYALVVPGLWACMEFLKQVIPCMVPWADLGYAALGGRYYVQIAELCGGLGVSFFLVMVNSLIGYLGREFMKGKIRDVRACLKKNRFAVGLLFLAFAMPHVYGIVRLLPDEKEPAGQPIQATLVQACFSQKDRWSGLGFANRIRTYVKLSELDSITPPGIVMWPETVLNSSTRVDDNFFRDVIRAIGPNNLLISGGLRKPPNGQGTFNTAFFISGQGRVTAYDKHILLPYAENAPAGDVLGDYYTAPSQFIPGLSPLCMDTSLGKIGASICFEILYPGHVRKSVCDGARVLVNLSNDSWFNSTMPYMHLDAARMRAIENRRYVLRASNSGFCAIIAPDGSVEAQSDLGKPQMIRGICTPSDKLTPFSCFGSWVVYLAGLAVLVGFLTRRQLKIRMTVRQPPKQQTGRPTA